MTIEVPLNAYEAGRQDRDDLCEIATFSCTPAHARERAHSIGMTAEAARRAVYARGFAAFAAAAPIATRRRSRLEQTVAAS
jgi:hypothetical protein